MPNFVLFSLVLLARFASVTNADCRCFPGDACWPTNQDWDEFNRTVAGKLVATTPLAAPCHDSPFGAYNASQCSTLQETWTSAYTHFNSSSSAMAPFFANQSCDPFTGRDAQCVLGTYVQYAVAVQSAQDVAHTLDFVKRNNIRLVIRNTGHDYNGKSTGAGALAVWTHHLKDIDVFDYSCPSYRGMAMKMGAGVQGFEAYAAAHEHDLAVVGGECPSVGLAGGYTQGGGHSALASKYGMGADQVLEWEVVDGQGNHLIATRQNNTDLFWALSGGGGGTYGIVLAMTVKAHPDTPTSGGNVTFTSDGVSQEIYWEAASEYPRSLPAIVDEGIMSIAVFDNNTFGISSITGPGISAERMEQLFEPLISVMDRLGISYIKSIEDFPNYFEWYNTHFIPSPIVNAVGIAQYGGRLIPRSAVLDNDNALTAAYRKICDNGGAIFSVGLDVSKAVAGDVFNSVNPAWRDALIHNVVSTPWNFTAPWSEMVDNADKMTNEFIPLLKEVSPGSGTYINEADFQDPDWKENYYGVNYDRLLEIKNKYDLDHIFYALTAVGSDYWEPQPDGRLCRS